MLRRPLIYVAGPYTNPDPVENTHLAIHVGNRLVDEGFSVIIPHLTMLWHAVTPKPYEHWLEIDSQYVLRSDALFRRRGASSGADGEVWLAQDEGIPVFYHIPMLIDWAVGMYGNAWRPKRGGLSSTGCSVVNTPSTAVSTLPKRLLPGETTRRDGTELYDR